MPLVAGNDCSQVYTISTLEKPQKEQNEEILGILDALNILLHTGKPGVLQSWGCRVRHNLMTEQQLVMFYLSYQGK